ncbi:DUF2252 family protein [Paraburkholderia strydomiana]|uniref:DUF2252 family protein n=1 Tax=Paraburkholderia strydomiana TaxID=1245417 RepID=UPI0038BBE47F
MSRQLHTGKQCSQSTWELRCHALQPRRGFPACAYPDRDQRMIEGLDLMQTAINVLPGWTRRKNGRDFYIRQLRDMRMAVVIEDWDAGMLHRSGPMCAGARHAHMPVRPTQRVSQGASAPGRVFEDAITEFATEYSGENRGNYRGFIRASREGCITARTDE